MGLFNLSRLCVAVFLITTVNLAYANYIYDPPTRRWLPTATTVLAPPNSGSVLVPSTSIPPNPTVNNGGFTTTMGGSIRTSPVNGATKRVPITINGTVTKTKVNNAVASRLIKGNLAGIALGYGIQQLLNGVGWIIDEGGKVSKKGETTYPVINDCIDCRSGIPRWHGTSEGCGPGHPHEVCAYDSGSRVYYCSKESNGRPLVGFQTSPNLRCLFSSDLPPPEPSTSPVPPQQIIDAVDNSYNPHSSDYPLIVSEPAMQPTETTVLPIPTHNFPSVQTTSTDLDTGQTTVTDTQTKLDFEIRNNGSAQPKIEEKKTEKTETYKDGVKTGSSTTTSSSGVATGGGTAPAPSPDFELPAFCDWAGIVCDWIGWTQEPLDDEPDLSALITDEDYERDYSINFGDSSCPAPITINVTFLNKSVELSYEPACELAHYAKPLVLISAYIFAIMITLGVVRNG